MSSYRWIPWTFAGALGVVVAVNAALAYFAVTTSTGLVTEHPFAAGNSYNAVLDAGAAQDALGWRGALRFSGTGPARGEIVAELSDRDGKPLTGLKVSLRLVRPIEPLPEIALALSERTPGHYEAEAAPSRPGQWEVYATARRGAELFEFAQRILVK